jgi:RNA polymerase sigma-70 factor (ECF subfamily)
MARGGQDAEGRFRSVFSHLPEVVAYARRRGSHDAEAIGAEAMTIAWRKLADVPVDDPLPWLYATARNLVRAEWRRRHDDADGGEIEIEAPEIAPHVDLLDPELAVAMRALSPRDCEALLLVAWEDLTPAQAARSLGITQAAFRVRLHRARHRLQDRLQSTVADPALVSLGWEDR